MDKDICTTHETLLEDGACVKCLSEDNK